MRDKVIGGARRAVRRLGKVFGRGPLILLYHRVSGGGPDPWSLAVTPEHFAQHLEVLRGLARPVPLRRLVGELRGGRPSPRSVAITFDDGYADNLYHARPLLERYDAPATVFVASGALGRGREFWWDELERVLLHAGPLPKTLRLSVNGTPHCWELADGHGEGDAPRGRESGAAPTSRRPLYFSLHELLYPLAEGARRGALDQLLEWAGANPSPRPTHRTLSPAEVSSLARCELTEIGAHTLTHPSLATLPPDEQWREIKQGKDELEDMTGGQVSSFAYPYGSRGDYSAETVALVRRAGFASACTTVEGPVRRSADPFQLPRVAVADCDGEEFSRRLSRLLR